jgi:hypothetical protein
MTVNIDQILPWLSLIIGLIAIAGFYTARRQGIMEQGKREARLDQLKTDLDGLGTKVRQLETDSRCTDITLAELKTDMRNVIEALNRIEGRINTLYSIEKGME